MKILIEMMHGMGDLVCALPMIKDVREKYPNAYITVLVNKESNIDIIKCSEIFINRCLVIEVHTKKLEAFYKCLKLRKEKYDLSISCVNTSVKKSRLIMELIGAERKIGIQFNECKSLNDLGENLHFVDAHRKAIEEIITPNLNYRPQLFVKTEITEAIRKKVAADLKQKVVGICIGQADVSYRNKRRRTIPVHTKGWGNFEEHIGNMQALIIKCLEQEWKVVLIGGMAEEIIRNGFGQELLCHSNLIDFVGKTSVEESIGIVSCCDVVVGVDTGMQHAADAAGKSTISLFGPTNPKRCGAYSKKAKFVELPLECKYCYGTSNYEWCDDRKCMKGISVEQVFNEILLTLENAEE